MAVACHCFRPHNLYYHTLPKRYPLASSSHLTSPPFSLLAILRLNMMMKTWVLTSQFPIAPGTAVASVSTSEIALFFSRRDTRRATTFSWQSMSRRRRIRALPETKEPLPPSSSSSTAEETTKKYGLEFGLWKIFSSKEGEEGKEKPKAEQAKELLTKYGGAYLATSITLSLISFSLCYLLINAGIDVPALLQKVGIAVDETGGKVGTFALAYAAHKAASPIRFPPTVALTPVVAGWIGKNRNNNNNKANDGVDDDNL